MIPSILVKVRCILGGGEFRVGASALEPCIHDELFQLFQLFLHPAVAGREADFGFQLLQGGLAMLDGVRAPGG